MPEWGSRLMKGPCNWRQHSEFKGNSSSFLAHRSGGFPVWQHVPAPIGAAIERATRCGERRLLMKLHDQVQRPTPSPGPPHFSSPISPLFNLLASLPRAPNDPRSRMRRRASVLDPLFPFFVFLFLLFFTPYTGTRRLASILETWSSRFLLLSLSLLFFFALFSFCSVFVCVCLSKG